jgi:sec-independent protein translocase protein TatC
MPSLDVEPEKEEGRQLGSMSLLQHLEELRKRIINSGIAVAVSFFACWHYAGRIYHILEVPFQKALEANNFPLAERKLAYLNPTEPFNLYMKIGLIAGIFVASPIVLYQVWLFISPGLYRREKRYVLPFMFLSVGLFLAGGYFGYRVVYPVALDFLIKFGGDFKMVITVKEYTSLSLTIILGLAIIFELPIVIGFTALMGVVDARFLFRHIRGAIFLFFVVAAVLSPTTDILNMTIYAAPMVALYILSIGIAWLVHPKQRRRRAEKNKTGEGTSPWPMIFPLVLLVLIGGFAAGYLHMHPRCPEQPVLESASPDHQWTATAMQRKCGKDGPFITHINLRPANGPIHYGFFSGKAEDGEVFTLEREARELHLSLVWDSPTQLTIQCSDCAAASKHQERWGNVLIRYQLGGR